MSSEVLWMVLPGIVREAQSAGVLSPQESHSLHRELQPLLREFVILQESANPAGVSTPAGLVESLYCQSPPIYKTAIRAISWSQRPRARGGSSGRNSLNIWKWGMHQPVFIFVCYIATRAAGRDYESTIDQSLLLGAVSMFLRGLVIDPGIYIVNPGVT